MLIYNPTKKDGQLLPDAVVDAEVKVLTVIGDDMGCELQIVSYDGSVKTVSVVTGESLCVVE